MPASENWPFTRIFVDHLFYGSTRVWWRLDAGFNAKQPHVFQLQAGYAGPRNALDWVNIGDPATNAYFLTDDSKREMAGVQVLTHYRIVLTAENKTYVSNAQHISGFLDSQNWNIAREIIRKEKLRLDVVGVPGYLLKRFRYGAKGDNLDYLTDAVLDARDKQTWGTAFKVGYHPPVAMQLDFLPSAVAEQRGGDNPGKYSADLREITARVIGFPEIAKEDVWVDAVTDERWAVDELAAIAAIAGVPLVRNVKLRKIAHSDIVYQIPVTVDSYDPTDTEEYQPTTGEGCVRVDHDHGEQSALVYQAEDCCPISGATIKAFLKDDWDNGLRTDAYVKATSQTDATGAWVWAMQLDPATYVLQFEKLGEYGPDIVEITVSAPTPPPAPSSNSSSSDSSSWSDFGPF